jgi:mannosyltransferase
MVVYRGQLVLPAIPVGPLVAGAPTRPWLTSLLSLTMTGQRFLLLSALALGFGARVFRLDGQSLWGDEAISVSRATQSLLDITRAAPHEGTLPPLYYYLLHFWEPLVGTSEFAVRFLSVIFGVLTIAVLAAAVRASAGHRPALVATFLASISPFWVYYSQETRMYAPATFFALASTWFFLLMIGDSRLARSRAVWGGYILTSALAVFTHYFAGFVLLAQNCVFGLILLHGVTAAVRASAPEPRAVVRSLRPAIAWSAAQVSILGLLTPWVVYTRESLAVTASAVDRAAIPLAGIARHLFTTFSLGTSVEQSSGFIVSLGFLAIALFGCIRQPRQAAFWGALLAVPVLAIYYVSFTPHQGWARYFMVASPAWLVLVALGVDSLLPERAALATQKAGRAARSIRSFAFWLVLTGLALACSLSLHAYYTDPRYGRYDWRGAIARMEAASLPSVAVVVNGPSWLPEFDYYFRGRLDRFDLPRPGLQEWPQIELTLRQAAAAHTGIWLVKYYPPDFDPDGNLEGWLARNAFRASGEWVENATFSFYSLPRPGLTVTTPLSATFGGDISLRQVGITRVPDRDGAVLQLTLTWQANAPIREDYTVFVHLLDATDVLVAQRDSPPVSGFRPTSGWVQGDIIEDRLGLYVPQSALTKPLHLRMGLYRPSDGLRLQLTGGPTQTSVDFVEVPAP